MLVPPAFQPNGEDRLKEKKFWRIQKENPGHKRTKRREIKLQPGNLLTLYFTRFVVAREGFARGCEALRNFMDT